MDSRDQMEITRMNWELIDALGMGPSGYLDVEADGYEWVLWDVGTGNDYSAMMVIKGEKVVYSWTDGEGLKLAGPAGFLVVEVDGEI